MALLITNQGQCVCLAFFLVLILAFCSSQASCSRQLYGEDKIMLQRFEEWMAKHGRVYKDAQEKELRYDIFKSSVEFIEAFNENKDQRKYTLSINKFADRKNEELRSMRNGYNVRQHLSKKASNSMKGTRNTFFKYENVTEVPPSCDWTTSAVTPVKDQGYDCGAGQPSISMESNRLRAAVWDPPKLVPTCYFPREEAEVLYRELKIFLLVGFND
ncbi:PREDICTED: senescence-specific cysteine protease SAG12-like [Prunus mume]|uniref:Senescence-specific cysteine protease SAG12-like n=1 Tax=Prunus mume TaxID=102107 RepID=A0ABM1LLD9_PRUMU|nr:PREDICTED: senescence-specific cysteine protease SAG12-like [Prunus mume]